MSHAPLQVCLRNLINILFTHFPKLHNSKYSYFYNKFSSMMLFFIHPRSLSVNVISDDFRLCSKVDNSFLYGTSYCCR